MNFIACKDSASQEEKQEKQCFFCFFVFSFLPLRRFFVPYLRDSLADVSATACRTGKFTPSQGKEMLN